MPEMTVGAEGQRGSSATFQRRLLQDCYTAELDRGGSAKVKKLACGRVGERKATTGKETMPADLGLLLEAVAGESPAGLQRIAVAAEGVPHQDQIEAAAALRLPHMGQHMNEEALGA